MKIIFIILIIALYHSVIIEARHRCEYKDAMTICLGTNYSLVYEHLEHNRHNQHYRIMFREIEFPANTLKQQYFNFNLFKDVEALDIWSSNIHTIDDNTFKQLTNLKVLDLGINKLKHVTLHQLNGLQQLRELYVMNNSLTYFDCEILTKLNQIEVLLLRSNQIRKFNCRSESLTELDLSNNPIENLDIKQLKTDNPQLQRIYLQNNSISCKNLREILSVSRRVGVETVAYDFRELIERTSINGIKCDDKPK